jgi:hypothetical protein
VVGPSPVLPARWLLAATVLVLPSDCRDRYREELRTEIAELGAASQLPQAVSLLVGSFALRSALTARDVPAVAGPRKSLLCRIGRHRYVVRPGDNPELKGRGYLQCVRCGKQHDPPTYHANSGSGIGWGGPAPTG